MTKNKRTLIVGYGEIGSSLHKVLSKVYDVQIYDNYKQMFPVGTENYDVMHICFPPIKRFCKTC